MDADGTGEPRRLGDSSDVIRKVAHARTLLRLTWRPGGSATQQTADTATVRRDSHPFIPVLEWFDAPSDIQTIVGAWDHGWLSVAQPDVHLELISDTWLGDGHDLQVFTSTR